MPRASRKLSLSHCSEAVKLDVSRYQLYSSEKEQLNEAWSRLSDVNDNEELAPSEAVLVHGNNGTGKSAFVHSLKRPVEMSNGIFLFSTVTDKSTNQPFSSISDALNQLCQRISEEIDCDFRNYVELAIGEEGMAALARVLPKLGDSGNANLFDRRGSLGSLTSAAKSDHGPTFAPHNVRSIAPMIWHFRNFVRALAQKSRPILFLLEDIHLADPASADLFLSLISDYKSRNILFVTTYTDLANDPFNQKVSKVITDSSPKIGDRIRKLSLRDLTLHEVNQLVAVVTQMPAFKVFDLGSIVHQKTAGNFYLVCQFLELLQEQNLLLYSFKTSGWEWDVARIERETDVSENVADIIVKRIHRLPESAQKVLKIAACLGAQFELALVALIIAAEENLKGEQEAMGDGLIFDSPPDIPLDCDTTSIEQDFDYLYQTGLIENGVMGLSKFSHDKVQQASYALIPPGSERDHLHLRVGRILYELHEDPTFNEEWMFFSATDQLNKGRSCMKHDEDLAHLVKLNMEAGALAKSQAAFKVAAVYLNTGVKLLESTASHGWRGHYELCLDLYSSAAEMEQGAGNIEHSLDMVNEVFTHATSADDKLRCYFVQIQIFGSQGALEDAVSVGLKVLKNLGMNIPRRPRSWHLVAEINKTKNMLKGSVEEIISNSKTLEDQRKLVTLEFLHVISMYSHNWQGSDFLPIIFLKSIQTSVKHGFSEYTPYAFANFAILMNSTGDHDSGAKYASVATTLMKNLSEESKAEVMFVVHAFLHHWKHPLRQSLDPLVKSYTISMNTGNLEFASASAGMYAMIYCCAGLPLAHVASDLRRFRQQTIYQNLDTAQSMVVPGLQYILNLMGESDDPLVLTGEEMDQDSLLRSVEESGNRVAVRSIYRYRLLLAILFEGELSAVDLIRQLPKDDLTASFGYAREIFACGLIYVTAARVTGRRKYLRRGQRHMKLIHKWTKAGNVNCHDMLLLLQAEILSMDKRATSESVREAYDKAIASSSRCGYIHNAALANEKASRYFETILDDFWAEHYIGQAHDLYTQWNAKAKVFRLEEQHPTLEGADFDGQSAFSGSVQGRTRFKRELLSKHEKIQYKKTDATDHGLKREMVVKMDRSSHNNLGSQNELECYESSLAGMEIAAMHRQSYVEPLTQRRARAHRSVSPRRCSDQSELPSRFTRPALYRNESIRKLSSHTFKRTGSRESSQHSFGSSQLMSSQHTASDIADSVSFEKGSLELTDKPDSMSFEHENGISLELADLDASFH